MRSLLALEEFDAQEDETARHLIAEEELEAQKVQAFEQGYKAGWDDAAKASQEQQAKAETRLADQIRELDVTYSDARQQVVDSFVPVLRAFTSTVSATLCAETLSSIVEKKVASHLSSGGEQPVVLAANAQSVELLRSMLSTEDTRNFSFRVQESLSDGQTQVSFGGLEELIDVDTACEELRTLLEEYFIMMRKGQFDER